MAKAKAKARGRGRKLTKRFPTTPIQGTGSFVVFQKPKWGEIRLGIKEIRADARERVIREDGVVRLESDTAVEDLEEDLVGGLWNMCVDKFVEWNWLDEEGEPLPRLPDLNSEDLLGEEVQFLFDIIQSLYMIRDMDEEGNARRP